MTKTARTAMIFPLAMKDEIQLLAGKRGMTEWVLNACREKLGKPIVEKTESDPDLTGELKEARDLVQVLANSVVTVGESDPHEILRALDLPSWVDTSAWPGFYQDVVPEPEPELEPEPEAKAKAEPQDEQAPEEFARFATSPSDYMAKVMSKAEEFGLQRASDLVPKPKGQTDLSELEKTWVGEVLPEETEDESEQDLNAAIETIEIIDVAELPRCPECGSALVNNECWECF